MDDPLLYVACWGTGDLQQYDVSDPFNPKLTGKVRIGGIVSRATHPGAKNGKLNGGPQMVEVSRDGRRVYFTNSLYGAIDPQFYPEGIDGWMVKLDARPAGGIAFDPKFFIDWPKGHRPHQVRLQGGDCSSDSYSYPGCDQIRAGSRTRTGRIGMSAVPTEVWPWLALAGLGLFHGLNPAMGWLFAVALGLHRGSQRIVLLSLVPIAVGHAAAVAAVLL